MTISPRLATLLEGPAPFHAVEHLSEATSTNDVAAERLAAGAAPGLVVVADSQTAGRGRAGRAWVDHGEGSLLASALVATPPHATLVPLAVGAALSHAIRRAGARAEVKWPNDVLIGGAKCGGVLVENHGDGTLIVGFGVDLDWRGVAREGDARGWVSVAEATGREVDRWDVLTDTLAALGSWLLDLRRDPSVLLATYEARCVTLRRQVVATLGDGSTVTGVATGIRPDGALLIRSDRGDVAVVAGDVRLVR